MTYESNTYGMFSAAGDAAVEEAVTIIAAKYHAEVIEEMPEIFAFADVLSEVMSEQGHAKHSEHGDTVVREEAYDAVVRKVRALHGWR